MSLLFPALVTSRTIQDLVNMRWKTFCISVALVSKSFALPNDALRSRRDVSFELSIREKLGGPPRGWVEDESVDLDKNSMMSLRIHLVHQDMDKFHQVATNVRSITYKRLPFSQI